MEKFKSKKMLLILAIVVLLLFVFIGTKSGKDPVVGTWKLQAMIDGDAVLDITHLNSDMKFSFKDDHTGYAYNSGEGYSFTWEVLYDKGTDIVYQIDNGKNLTNCFLIDAGSRDAMLMVHVSGEKYFGLVK